MKLLEGRAQSLMKTPVAVEGVFCHREEYLLASFQRSFVWREHQHPTKGGRMKRRVTARWLIVPSVVILLGDAHTYTCTCDQVSRDV